MKTAGNGTANNLIATLFMLMRFGEAFFRVPFLAESSNKVYMISLGAYAAALLQLLYLQGVSTSSQIDMVFAVLMVVPLGVRVGINIYNSELNKVMLLFRI